jgi:hypothetical protein
MVATIHKRYVLDTEFFGQKIDIKYVDVSARSSTSEREVHRYSPGDLELWPERRLAERLSLIAEALDYLRSSNILRPRKRPALRQFEDMPLF